MKVGIGVDDWKRPVFEEKLREAGYYYEVFPGLAPGCSLIKVEAANLDALRSLVEKCQEEAAFREPELKGLATVEPRGNA